MRHQRQLVRWLVYFARGLSVYGREGLLCPRCGTSIRRVAFTDRSSHFCLAANSWCSAGGVGEARSGRQMCLYFEGCGNLYANSGFLSDS